MENRTHKTNEPSDSNRVRSNTFVMENRTPKPIESSHHKLMASQVSLNESMCQNESKESNNLIHELENKTQEKNTQNQKVKQLIVNSNKTIKLRNHKFTLFV